MLLEKTDCASDCKVFHKKLVAVLDPEVLCSDSDNLSSAQPSSHVIWMFKTFIMNMILMLTGVSMIYQLNFHSVRCK